MKNQVGRTQPMKEPYVIDIVSLTLSTVRFRMHNLHRL
jgi:hypothetical protein